MAHTYSGVETKKDPAVCTCFNPTPYVWSYTNAFAEHGRKSKTKLQIWRHAWNESAGLSGIESSNFRNDVEFLKRIFNLVLTSLGKPLVNSKGIVGIDKIIADVVESLICKKPEDIIEIWGMGGIGKTTLAEEVFNKQQCEYEGCYFLANGREQSSRHEIISLKDVVKIDTPNWLSDDIFRRIGRVKVLIVLDDLNA